MLALALSPLGISPRAPRTIFPFEFSADLVLAIIASNSIWEIIRVANVELSCRILNDVCLKHHGWLQR